MSEENGQKTDDLLLQDEKIAQNDNLIDDRNLNSIQDAKERNEVVLRLLGNPGKYTVVIYVLGFCLNFFVAFNHVTLPSLYAIPVAHRCISKNEVKTSYKNISVGKNSLLLNASNEIGNQCFRVVGRDKTNLKRVSCNKWEYIYPHGYTKTWMNQWNLVCDKKFMLSLGQSIYMAGVMAGSPLTGMASDRFGRRNTLLACLFISSIVSIILPFTEIISAISLRFIIGFFISGVHSIVYVAPPEMSVRRIVPILSVAIMNSFIIGIFIGNTIIYFAREWKTAQLILCSPSMLLFILTYFIYSESPSWALVRQNKEKYLSFFKNAMNVNRLSEETHSKIQEILDQCEFDNHKFSSGNKKTYTLVDLFKTPVIRKRSLISIYIWFTCGVAFYTLSYNIPNLSEHPFLALLVGSATDLPCFFLAFLYVPRIGKRKSLITAQLIGGLFCLMYKFIPNLAILLIGKMFVAVSFGITFIYVPEILPTVIRNIGVGTLSFFSRIGGLVAPQLVFLGVYTSVYVPVVVVGCLTILGAILTIIAPETKGKDLPNFIEDIELTEEDA